MPLRSPRVAKLYASVWMEDGSPLMVYSRQQQQALAQRLPDTPVALGMSYGSPSLESAVDELLAEHVDHIVVLPLYPQFSCSTVGAVWDELARILARKRSIPGISFIRDYADNHDYINALANSVRASFAKHGEPDLLLLSYHGIPQRYALEEIAEQNREVFLGAGGKKYEYIPALNATPEHIEMMANLVAAYR